MGMIDSDGNLVRKCADGTMIKENYRGINRELKEYESQLQKKGFEPESIRRLVGEREKELGKIWITYNPHMSPTGGRSTSGMRRA